jgi:hypothetical protein
MRKVKLLGLAALALFAFGAFTAVSAYAVETEEEGKPQILVLEGEAKALKGTLTAKAKEKAIELVPLTGEKRITAEEASLLLENCENLKANVKDTNLCTDVPLHFTGVKLEGASCRSENSKGEKDPAGTVLTLLDLHVAAELTSEKVLQPLIFAKVLGTGLEEEVKLVCALLKIKVDNGEAKPKAGVITCLLGPGLTNTTKLEVLCKVDSKKSPDPEVGTCNVLCEDFGKVIGLTASFGETKIDAWELIHLLGEVNKDVYIDD